MIGLTFGVLILLFGVIIYLLEIDDKIKIDVKDIPFVSSIEGGAGIAFIALGAIIAAFSMATGL